ncbi:StAR-related lipid transfer protein 7 [Schistosoma japonicum]|nr:StAR-related lipid transfer protein 7 [Schistosoma japonicum]
MGVIKYVLQSPVFVQLNSLTKHLSSQIEKACCQPDSTFSKFLLSSHRTLLANVFLCRHSGRLVVRRLRDKYLSSHLNVKTDSRLFVTQKVLLGGSLISFAQDKITDEEVLTTLKGFSVNADSYNSCESSPLVIENIASKEDSNSLVVEDLTQNELCKSWDPPLTLMIRELRETYLRRISMFIRPTVELVSSDDPCVSFHDADSPVNEFSNEDYFIASLFSLLTNLNIQPDGTSFVDDSWELIYDRPGMHIWRRPLNILQINGERNSSKSSNKYEYRGEIPSMF